MDILYIRIASVVVIAAMYTVFDVFNRRNVPSLFAYATLAYGAVLTLLYFNLQSIFVSALIAIVVLALGYVAYRLGQLGGADAVELAALSLILPIQSMPILNASATIGLPFVVSVVMNSGIAALVIVPLYYIPMARSRFRGKLLKEVNRMDAYKGLAIVVAYSVLVLFLISKGIGDMGVVVVALILVGGGLIMLFQRPITMSMVKNVTYRGMEEEDILALNLMGETEIKNVKKSIPGFGRLISKRQISDLKKHFPRTKFPVYKNAVPFALPILVGSIAALLVGNLVLYIIPFFQIV